MNEHTHIVLEKEISAIDSSYYGLLPTWIYSWVREQDRKVSGNYIRYFFIFRRVLLYVEPHNGNSQ